MATATNPAVSLYEYLHTSYRPDCDYVDGVIEERNLGELDHAAVQRALLLWMAHNWDTQTTYSIAEIRIQVSPSRYRVADICVTRRSAPIEQILQTPPLAVIEVLSPEDRVSRYYERIADYREMGIANIWVIDPAQRKGFNCSSGSWIKTGCFELTGLAPALDLNLLFEQIESRR